MNDCAGCSSPHGRKALEDLLEGWPGRLRAGCRRQSFHQSFDRYPAHSLDDKWRNRVRSSAKIIGDSPTRVVSRRLIVHFEHQPIVALLPLHRAVDRLLQGSQVKPGDSLQIGDHDANNSALIQHTETLAQKSEPSGSVKM